MGYCQRNIQFKLSLEVKVIYSVSNDLVLKYASYVAYI